VREHDHLELLEVKKRWVESGGKAGSVFRKKSWEVGIFFLNAKCNTCGVFAIGLNFLVWRISEKNS